MRSKYILFCLFIFTLSSFSWQFPSYSISHLENSSSSWATKESKLLHASGLSGNALKISLIAYEHAKQKGLTGKKLLTVIDFSKPATEKRLWVFDLKNGKTLFNTWVTHGRNSGNTSSTSFSNRAGSLKSSIGVFLTDHTYIGGNGYSLRLKGLETGINDHAYNRLIVVHGARYVNPDMIRKYGKIGRSWGCPAVSPALSRPIINAIKDKTILVAYYPNQSWLLHSKFLTS